ncbi:MAG: carbohydrate ABC transporter permease [Eubacteriales bacterium]|nr:carbohydrate ABC transporter permease [Eubacteriales bacterium]
MTQQVKISQKNNTFLRKNQWWKYALSLLIIVIYLLPIYAVIMMAFKSPQDLSSRLSMPKELYLGSFEKALDSGNLLNALKNTAIITIGVILIEVIAGCMAAYPLARNHAKFNKFVMNVVLSMMMVPALSIVVGMYSLLVSLHGISTYWGIILVTAAFGLPLSIFLYRNFITAIPESLDEAAAIDGASTLQTFFHVILPQLAPVTVSVIIMKGIGAWNEFAFSLYVLQKSKMYNITLTIKQFFSETSTDLNAAAAGALIAILPTIIVYLVLQKYFVQGTLDSAVKG